MAAVRVARKRLGLPAAERGPYELERLINPGALVCVCWVGWIDRQVGRRGAPDQPAGGWLQAKEQ